LSVCFVVDGNHQESYRSLVPAAAMRRRGIKADVIPSLDMKDYRVSQWNVLVFRNWMGPEKVLEHLVSLLRAGGQTIVHDADDDPYGHFAASKFDPLCMARLAHVNTVSTPALKKKILNAVVLPNCLDFSLWAYRPKDHPLTVGLVGGASHLDDWRQVEEPLRRIQERYDNVRIVVGGYFPGYLRDLDVKFIPWKKYEEYPDTIREIDILLCPLNDDSFNLFKSGVKALEGMSQGCVPVCSDHPVYRRVVNQRHNGLLVKGNWDEAISLLVEDGRLRKKLSDNGRKWVRKNRDIDIWVRKYIQTYSGAR